MPKQIIIIGGGISGLALLHYLKQKYAGKDVGLQLLEKNDHLGGTIRTIKQGGCLFETGPNGFLDSKKRTLDFVHEIGLDDSLVRAEEESKIRYLSVNNALHPLPMGPKSFLSFSLLNPIEKVRVLGEMFVQRGTDPDESVYDFGRRRFGAKFSQVFLDPMVSGVYAGDARQAHLQTVFPRIAELEREHGSLFKAMFKIRKARRAQGNGGPAKSGNMGSPAGTITSFRHGMGQAIQQLSVIYKDHIRLSCPVEEISEQGGQYLVRAAGGQERQADELYICSPAYSAASLVRAFDVELAGALERVFYAPVAVVGLVCSSDRVAARPKGFGYLIPSSENKEILGVLFENNIFPGRCGEGLAMFRIMIGGARHPDILKKSREELMRLALGEITQFAAAGSNGITEADLKESFFVPIARAIPQYDRAYCATRKIIDGRLRNHPRLRLVANYLNGVALNDCIENAYRAAQNSSLN